MWHCANRWSVYKISRLLYCLKTLGTDHPMTEGTLQLHPYKSIKTIPHHHPLKHIRSEFWVQARATNLSRGQQPVTDHRIWYVIRKYNAYQSRQKYLPMVNFSTWLLVTCPTNGITTHRSKNLCTWWWRHTHPLTSHIHAHLLACTHVYMWISRQQCPNKILPHCY